MDEIWSRDEIESPCVKICVLDRQSGYCLGCGRTGDEIRLWSVLEPEDRKLVMDTLPERLKSIAPKREGRRRRGARKSDEK